MISFLSTLVIARKILYFHHWQGVCLTNRSIVSAVREGYVLGTDTDGITSESGELCGYESKQIWHLGNIKHPKLNTLALYFNQLPIIVVMLILCPSWSRTFWIYPWQLHCLPATVTHLWVSFWACDVGKRTAYRILLTTDLNRQWENACQRLQRRYDGFEVWGINDN